MNRAEAKEIIRRHSLLFASMPDEVLEALDVLMNFKGRAFSSWMEDYDEMIKEIKIKMWNWRGNQSTSIDKIAMEKILTEVIDKYTEEDK